MRTIDVKKINIVASISLVVSLIVMAMAHSKPFTWRFDSWIGRSLDLLTVLFFIPVSIVTAIWLLIQFNKKYTTYKKINIIFYIFLLVNSIITFVPAKYKIGVYSPSILGCIYLVTFFLIIPMFFRLFYLDYKNDTKGNLITRSVIFILAIITYVVVSWIL